MTKDKSLIQSCVDHINTAIDVDPWAKELVAEMGKEILEQLNNSNDCISRQAAIDALDVLCQEHRYKIPGKRETYSQYNEAWQDALDRAEGAIGNLPSVQSEPHWIPVTERLPEPRIDVWVNSDIGQIQGYYEENAETWYASFRQGRDYLELIVNAWMPLPDPYQEEGDSE